MAGNMIVNQFAKAQTGLGFSRNVFSFKKSHKTNFLTGFIVPSIDPIKVLPGDTWDLSFSAVVRSATLAAPLLDDLYIDVCAFWVPIRLVMNDFAQYLGENDSRAWTLKQNVNLPALSSVECSLLSLPSSVITRPVPINKTYLAERYLAPHFGLRNDRYNSSAFADNDFLTYGLSVVKSRQYDLIYNEWWRDENLIDPILISKDSGTDLTIDAVLYGTGLGVQRKASMLSNLFNKCLPAPQRGDAPTLNPFGDIKLLPVNTYSTHAVNGNGLSLNFYSSGSNTLGLQNNKLVGYQSDFTDEDNAYPATPNNLWAETSNVVGFTFNQLRYLSMLQRFYEISAVGGMREVEFYQSFFGVTSSDARYIRSELLCQKRFRINVNQVVATADGTNGEVQSHLGDTGAYSLTAINDHLFRKTMTEYGYIHIQHVIRTQPSLSSGIDRDNFKIRFFDEYLPVFDHIGEQSIYTAEVFNIIVDDFELDEDAYIFGYNRAWEEYRKQYNTAVGIFTPGETLDYWTLTRNFTTDLNESNPKSIGQWFIEQSIYEFDRALLFHVSEVTPGTELATHDELGISYTTDRYQWLIDFYVYGKMARTMSKDSTPAFLGRL